MTRATNLPTGPEEHRFDDAPMISQNQVIHHQPNLVCIDFQNVVMQFSGGPRPMPTPVISHRVIMLSPPAAKGLISVLASQLKEYERLYGVVPEEPPLPTEIVTTKPGYTG